MFMESFLGLNFTWEQSTNNLINSKRRFKIMANIALIERSWLLNYSEIILLKRKLSRIQPNNIFDTYRQFYSKKKFSL